VGPDVGAASDALRRSITLAPKVREQLAFFLAVGPERDGAESTALVLRRRGWRELLSSTREALQGLEQSTGHEPIDRLINRNLLFAYFYGVGRALDDAQYYLVRSRAPWNGHGVTVRDWEALMWTVPAVQLADAIATTIARWIGERETIVFDFRPRPDFKASNREESLISKLVGTIWIDPVDKQVIRLEARLAEGFKMAGGLLVSLKPGAALVMEQKRMVDGVWLPRFAQVNLSVKVLLFGGGDYNKTIEWSDYKHFSGDVQDYKITAPKP